MSCDTFHVDYQMDRKSIKIREPGSPWQQAMLNVIQGEMKA